MFSGVKLVLMISCMGFIDDNSLGGFYGYWMLKVVFNMVGKLLVIDLELWGIVVVILYFGLVCICMICFNFCGIFFE